MFLDGASFAWLKRSFNMKSTSFVSVVLPVYNEEKYLDACLSSLINQSYRNFEIVIINDGSTDNSLNIIKKYPAKAFNMEHQGPGAARNLGVSHARGEIIVFADADMRFDKKYIENLIRPIVEKKSIGTFTKEEFVANYDNVWSRCWNINSGMPSDRRLPEDYPETENAFRAILKEYFTKAGGFETNEGYTDDSSISKKLKIEAINAKGAICYHYNPSSISEVFFSSRWIGRSKLFKPNLTNLLRFSLLNSLRICLKYFFNGAPFAIFSFKIIYDAGMLTGIFMNNGKTFK